MSLYMHATRFTCHCIYMSLGPCVTSSTCHFAYMSLGPRVTSSTCHFAYMSLGPHVTSSTCHFPYMSLGRHDTGSTCYKIYIAGQHEMCHCWSLYLHTALDVTDYPCQKPSSMVNDSTKFLLYFALFSSAYCISCVVRCVLGYVSKCNSQSLYHFLLTHHAVGVTGATWSHIYFT